MPYLFWSEQEPGVFGFTFDPDGKNLPADLAPWSKNGDGERLYRGPRPNIVIRTVERDGFYLARISKAKLTHASTTGSVPESESQQDIHHQPETFAKP